MVPCGYSNIDWVPSTRVAQCETENTRLRARLAEAERRAARLEAALTSYVEHAEYSAAAGHTAYMEICPTCQGIVYEARAVLEVSRD